MVSDLSDQADYVVEEVLARREDGTPLREQAILMRKSSDSDLLEGELVRRNILYAKYGGLKFLEAAHVKDVLALLRFVDNPRNRLAGFRTLQLLSGIGPGTADLCLEHLANASNDLHCLPFNPQPPAATVEDWPGFVDLMLSLASSETWPGQMTQVRTSYEPRIEQLHGGGDVRAGDTEQLEAMSEQYRTRDQFLVELTLDPPQATGDEAGNPVRDEDYLILSTVHSAKGQEWDKVFMLNVVDGTFPNEFSTDDENKLEEERRLMYVGMTRARDDLQHMAPLRFHVTQQHGYGDRHLYGAKSRFMTESLMTCFSSVTWPETSATAGDVVRKPHVSVDAGAAMRAMWD